MCSLRRVHANKRALATIREEEHTWVQIDEDMEKEVEQINEEEGDERHAIEQESTPNGE